MYLLLPCPWLSINVSIFVEVGDYHSSENQGGWFSIHITNGDTQ
jgi:hypothetical protein